MRSGREHLAWILAVEVRQGTLGVAGRGWGPAGNTGRGWSWLRSGREHWAWMVVVEVRQRTLWIASRSWAGGRGGQREEEEEKEEDEEDEEDQATDIKSNNPHLAGGEIGWTSRLGRQINPCLRCLVLTQTSINHTLWLVYIDVCWCIHIYICICIHSEEKMKPDAENIYAISQCL